MGAPDSSRILFGRLNQGRESAIIEVVQQYRERLCAMVAREMGTRFRRREDAEDAVQSALGSFFRNWPEKGWTIDHRGELWGLLATITRHKMLRHIEHHTTQGRDPQRETYGQGEVGASAEPSPAEAALAADLIEKVMEGLEPPDPEVFRLQLEGRTRGEIASCVGCTEASVRTKLARIRDRLRRLLDA